MNIIEKHEYIKICMNKTHYQFVNEKSYMITRFDTLFAVEQQREASNGGTTEMIFEFPLEHITTTHIDRSGEFTVGSYLATIRCGC